MAMLLEKDRVRMIAMDVLNSTEYYGLEGKEAEMTTAYTAGVLDMANAVIKAIDEEGGR